MIHMIDGTHLTARDREALNFAIEKKASIVRTARKRFEVTPCENGTYRAIISHFEIDDSGRRQKRIKHVTFTHKGA